MQKKIEVMRIVRVPPLGKLIVEIGDQSFRNLDEIENTVLQRQVIAAVGELVSFVNGYDALADAGYAPSRTPIGQGRDEEPLTPEQERFLAGLREPKGTGELTLEPPQPIPTPPKQTAPLPQPPPPASPPSVPAVEESESEKDPYAPPDSIAAQINGILARHMAQEEGLRGRDVHLEQTENSGLRIMVDGRAYARPGEIEDRHVQLVLRRALKEWDQT